jgi:hypothetical protein
LKSFSSLGERFIFLAAGGGSAKVGRTEQSLQSIQRWPEESKEGEVGCDIFGRGT